MTNAEDDILVRQALQADAESFGQLCRRYYPALVAVADSILLDHHLAEDAAQETLAEACRQLARLKEPGRFGPWVTAICRNVAKDMLRERLRRPAPLDPGAPTTADHGEEEPSELLAKALQQLPQRLREVVFLRFYNGWSYEKMAQVLGATPGSIDGRLRRAKKRIAGYLARNGFGKGRIP
ncbi:MAG: sigma-70 family RNA polymerase sigma factor [Planctomycetes bacterium]|jgi:RNA polymerase sigma-70 factor (ECF subfamily)|nr:sigma-70 family RNA polymerase sigma factor [Planctomycetota bacterium]